MKKWDFPDAKRKWTLPDSSLENLSLLILSLPLSDGILIFSKTKWASHQLYKQGYLSQELGSHLFEHQGSEDPFLSFSVGVCMCVSCHFSRVQLCGSVDCSLPGFSVHGILQARILEWFAMPSSRASSQPRDQTLVSSIYLYSQTGSFYH